MSEAARARGTRRVATGVGVGAAIGTMVVLRHYPLAVAGGAVVLVMVFGRARLGWFGDGRAARFLRRLVRVVAYLAAVPLSGVPALRPNVTATVIAGALGALPILFEYRNIRTAFSARYLAVAPIDATERARDLLLFGLGGAAQEFLYRGVLLAAVARYSAATAIVVAAAVFVLEHLLHPGGLRRWDGHDLVVQLFLGLSLGVVTVASGSLLAAIVGHTVYNLPNVILTLRRPSARHGTTGTGVTVLRATA